MVLPRSQYSNRQSHFLTFLLLENVLLTVVLLLSPCSGVVVKVTSGEVCNFLNCDCQFE